MTEVIGLENDVPQFLITGDPFNKVKETKVDWKRAATQWHVERDY